MTMNNFEHVTDIIKSNNSIKKLTTDTVAQFLTLHKEFCEKIASTYTRVGTIKDVADIFLPDDKMKILNEYKSFEQVQLVICGYNSCGKTSFIHEFLKQGNFLPAGPGAVTTRIVKFSYAPAEAARLLIHEGGVDSSATGDTIDLSKYFLPAAGLTAKEKRALLIELQNIIAKHLTRPEALNPSSEDFAEWASHLVEICVPSSVLKLGVILYDTPGFHFGDPPILVNNLQNLIKARRPSLLFLYENPSITEDSLKCFGALKLSLHDIADVGIFFLNTKADVTTILRDANIDEFTRTGRIKGTDTKRTT